MGLANVRPLCHTLGMTSKSLYYRPDPLTPDCAVEGCYAPMTQWDIYCEGHDYISEFAITRIETK